MPVHKVGKNAYQWGHQAIYKGSGAKAKAQKQAAAIFANGYRDSKESYPSSPATDPALPGQPDEPKKQWPNNPPSSY